MKKVFKKVFVYLSVLTIVVQSLSPLAYLSLNSKAYAETPTPTPTLTSPTASEGQAVEQTQPTETVTPTPTDVPIETITPASNAADATPTPTPVDNNSPPSTDSSNNSGLEGTTTTVTPAVESATITPTQEGLTTPENPKDEQLNLIILDNVSAPSIDLEAVQAEGSASLTTDKPDYAPTDTALITGSNLLPNTTYSLHIWSDDAPATSTTVNVTSDANGVFAYAYQLDGIYRPNYSAELKDSSGTVVATVTFTDTAESIELEQVRNGSAASPDVTPDWVHGNAGASNSHYVEGFSIPYRAVMKNIPTGTPITVTIEWDIKHNSKHAIDYITHYQRLEPHSPFGHSAETIDPTAGVSGVSGSVTSTFPIPAPSSTGSPMAGQPTTSFNLLPAGEKVMSLWNGTITAMSYLNQGDLNGSNESSSISITFTATSSTAVLSWGGHIAREIDWGLNNSASGINGSPYHTRLKTWTLGNIGNEDRSLSADAIEPPSSITIIKDADPNDAQDFAFTTTGNGLSSFSLDDDSDGTLSNTTTFNSLLAGQFTVAETPVTGWTLSSKNCVTDGTGSTFGTTTDGVSVNLIAGENVTCTFTNTLNQTHLTLVKEVTNDNGGSAAPTAWTLSASGPTPISGTTGSSSVTNALVTAGTYTLSESGGPSGYSASQYSCVKNNNSPVSGNSITLAPGDNATCAINNNDQSATLIVKKVVVNDNGGNKTASDFTFKVNNGSAVAFEADGQNDLSVDAGTYSVTEPAVSGYSTTYNNCSNLVIPNGGSATCTITNDDNAPSLTLNKIVVNDNGGTAAESNWTLTATGPTTLSGAGAAGSTDVVSGANFEAGTYTLSESAGPSGYSASSWTCTNNVSVNGNNQITLGLGQTTVCSITNDDNSPSLTLIKEVSNSNGGTQDASAWTLTATGSTGFSGTGPSVSNGASFDAGTYTLSESGPSGYSASNWSCTGTGSQNGNQITLGLGQSATCTITNSDIAPTLKLVKHVTNDNGGTKTPADWTLYATGTNGFNDLGNSTTFHTVKAGVSYALSESNISGYSAGNWSCDGGTLNGSSLTLGLNQNVTCEITNNDNTPLLTLIKEVKNDNGGTAVAKDWTLSADGPTPISGAGGTTSGSDFKAGTYTLSESTGPDGYSAGSWNCTGATQNGDTVTIGLGESATCTIINDDIQPKLTVTKVLNNKDLVDTQISDFPLSVGTSSVLSGVQNGFDVGSYVVSEQNNTNYSYTTEITGDCDANGDVTLAAGDVKACTITNTLDTGTITVNKILSPSDDPGKFDLRIDGITEGTGENVGDGGTTGAITFPTGTHNVSEAGNQTDLSNYSQSISGIGCSTDGIVNLTKDQDIVCTITNTRQTGDLLVHKLVDRNGNNQFTSGDDSEFKWGFDSTTPSNNTNNFGDPKTLNTGSYDVYENSVPGYKFIGWFYGEQGSCNEEYNTSYPINVSVYNDEPTEITLCNKSQAPKLTIAKTNDAVGNKAPGDAVTYTLTVTATRDGGPAENVKVTDLLPNGFKYRLGSWTSNSTERGDLKTLGTTTEPTYASPGTWNLGNMIPGEIVTLTYIADINTSQQAGTYYDNAWAQGTAVGDSTVLLASADPDATDGNIGDPNFVGTQVKIVTNNQSGSYNSKVTKEVLGAETFLPATGENTLWVIIATILSGLGLGSLLLGFKLRRKYAKN